MGFTASTPPKEYLPDIPGQRHGESNDPSLTKHYVIQYWWIIAGIILLALLWWIYG